MKPPSIQPAPTSRFMFATGIECSYPTIVGADGRTVRVDELERTYHYRHWKQDLALVRDLGLRFLRYGPPYYRIHLGPGRYDWEFTDLVFAELARLGIVPIVDLCHFGLPDWLGDFQNPEWPQHFAAYAGAFAQRFPWVQFYTPVNEIFVCAKLSCWVGFWNERKTDDRSFVTAIKHLCRANLLAIQEILKRTPGAVFIQSESAEYYHQNSDDPEIVHKANWHNQVRFLSFDLLFSNHPNTEVGMWLFENGMSRAEYDWFMHHGLSDRIILGNDYYERNEQIVTEEGGIVPAGEIYGWPVITRQYWVRYPRPVMHTETNTIQSDVDPERWLWKEFLNVRNLRDQGVPVIGFTWFSLLDQVDWDAGLSIDRGIVNPVGLYDLRREPRPVADAYRTLLERFGGQPLLPNTSVFSIALPSPLLPEDPSSLPQPKPRHTVEHRPPLSRATVAIARTTDEGVDEQGIEALTREALAHLGGLKELITPGDTVLIKPNQSVWRLAKDGATTDPRLVSVLARLAREAGAGTVLVGECSSCGQVTQEIMEITGMERAARQAGAVPVYFDEVDQVEIDVPLGQIIHRIPVPKPLLEADVVIAVPKLKTHFLDPITGALKLWVGAARQDTMHRLHRDQVQETVADLLTVTRPDLVVMDAIVAGEGNGPVATRGRFVGCVLASSDPVALDVIAGDLAGFDGQAMSFPQAAARRNVGICDRERIEVRGVPVNEARVELEPERLEGWAEQYAVRVIVGEGVTLAGTLGHFKGFADLWQADHVWDAIVATRGRPTFLIGRREDPELEQHLAEGTYFVLDDAALEKYRRDPRVVFIPGSPIGNEMMPVIMEALGVDLPGRAAQRMLKAWNALKARWRYG